MAVNILKKVGYFFLLLLIYAVLAFALMAVVVFLTKWLFLPDDYLFYEHAPIAGVMLLFLVLIPPLFICHSIIKKLNYKLGKEMEENEEALMLWSAFGKLKFILIVVWIIALYCCFSCLTVVTSDKIIRHTPFSPNGKEYSYSDVSSVQTGFGNKFFAVSEYKKDGNFFYKLDLDGKTVVFHQPNVNENIQRYNADTYLELEEFDIALMNLGVYKISDPSGYEDCYYDKVYVDRFLGIINRKSLEK